MIDKQDNIRIGCTARVRATVRFFDGNAAGLFRAHAKIDQDN